MAGFRRPFLFYSVMPDLIRYDGELGAELSLQGFISTDFDG